MPDPNLPENVTDLAEIAKLARARGEERPKDLRVSQGGRVEGNEIQSIQDRTREVARLAAFGLGNVAIAEFVGMSTEQVSRIRNSTIFRKYVDELQEARDQSAIDFRNDIEALIPQAIETYERVLAGEEGTPNLRVKVAGEVLDRTGISPVKQTVVQQFNAKLTMQDIAEIRARAEASRKQRQALKVNAESSEA